MAQAPAWRAARLSSPNAGISGGLASLFEQSVEDWQEILRVNLIGPFLAIKHAAPVIKQQGGGSIHLHRLGRWLAVGRGRPGL
jgi:NADP-dependent 3-hydroxy acid dehydrogenase YdfG